MFFGRIAGEQIVDASAQLFQFHEIEHCQVTTLVADLLLLQCAVELLGALAMAISLLHTGGNTLVQHADHGTDVFKVAAEAGGVAVDKDASSHRCAGRQVRLRRVKRKPGSGSIPAVPDQINNVPNCASKARHASGERSSKAGGRVHDRHFPEVVVAVRWHIAKQALGLQSNEARYGT